MLFTLTVNLSRVWFLSMHKVLVFKLDVGLREELVQAVSLGVKLGQSRLLVDALTRSSRQRRSELLVQPSLGL